MKKLPIHIKIILAVIIIAFIYKGITSVTSPTIDLYNKTTELSLSLRQVEQKQLSNYDAYYLAFKDKHTNADLTKQSFIELTNIIMSARKDGNNLAWKWNQENQQIPFEEFTVFYKELSSFISERYNNNALIEQQKQQIVQQHNLMISTFPNNLYNKYLGVNPLVYKFGYLSEETKNKFKN